MSCANIFWCFTLKSNNRFYQWYHDTATLILMECKLKKIQNKTLKNPRNKGERQKSKGILNNCWGRQHSPLKLMKFSWLALYEYLAFIPQNFWNTCAISSVFLSFSSQVTVSSFISFSDSSNFSFSSGAFMA